MTEPSPATPTAPPLATEPERRELGFGRAMALSAAATGVVWAIADVGHASFVAVGAVLWAIQLGSRGWLRAQPMVLANVTWLVVCLVAKLAFLDSMSATPLPFLLGVLGVQYLAQLVHDLRAFANAGDTTPPVTYSVTFALASFLAIATGLFHAARTTWSAASGIALATTLAASCFLLVLLWWDWTRKAFASLKMAVTLLSLIALGSIVGTVVIQHMPEDSVQAHYDKFMNGEGAAPVNARYLFRDPDIEWTAGDDARQEAMNRAFGPGEGDRWAKLTRHDRARKAKEAEGRRWVAAHEMELQRFYEVCESVGATRIFKTWTFNALLVLLAATVVGVMVRRFPYERRDAGWVATHAGIVFLLLCFAGSDLAVRDGFVSLTPTASPGATDAPTDVRAFNDLLRRGTEGATREFPWTLRLVRTSADWYQELAVEIDGDAGAVTTSRSYPVLPGKVVELARPSAGAPPRYTIEMLDVVDRCRLTRVGFKPGTTSGVAALQLLVTDGSRTSDRWITDGDPPLPLPGGELRFVSAKGEADVDEWTGARLPRDAGTVGFVRVTHGEEVVARIPATVGQKADVTHGGVTWRATVTDVFLDASKATAEAAAAGGAKTPVERQFPNVGFAAMSMETDGQTPQRARAFGEGADESVAMLENPVLKAAGLSFTLELVLPREVRIVALPDGSVVLVEETRAGVSVPRLLAEGDPLPIGASEAPAVTVGPLVRDAELDVDVASLPSETDAEYMRNGLKGTNEQIGNPAVRVRVTEPATPPYELWIVGADPWKRVQVAATRDRRVRIALTSTAESMYRSAVQAVDAKGTVLGEHVVRVNAPFRMGGYEFYQNQFLRPDQGGPAAVFRVKYDPFIPWIYAGFVVVAAGVIALLWFPGQRAFKLHEHLARLPEDRP